MGILTIGKLPLAVEVVFKISNVIEDGGPVLADNVMEITTSSNTNASGVGEAVHRGYYFRWCMVWDH